MLKRMLAFSSDRFCWQTGTPVKESYLQQKENSHCLVELWFRTDIFLFLLLPLVKVSTSLILNVAFIISQSSKCFIITLHVVLAVISNNWYQVKKMPVWWFGAKNRLSTRGRWLEYFAISSTPASFRLGVLQAYDMKGKWHFVILWNNKELLSTFKVLSVVCVSEILSKLKCEGPVRLPVAGPSGQQSHLQNCCRLHCSAPRWSPVKNKTNSFYFRAFSLEAETCDLSVGGQQSQEQKPSPTGGSREQPLSRSGWLQSMSRELTSQSACR